MGKEVAGHHEKKLDDYVHMGWYVVLVCIMAELMIIPHVNSQFYMMYAGAAPLVKGCDGMLFTDDLKDIQRCEFFYSSNCSIPEVSYEFRSVNVEYGYFCNDAKKVKNSISIQMLGVLLGSVVFGQLSDSFGRKTSMLLSMVGMMSSWFIVAFARDLTHFTAARTIVGFFTGGSISVVNIFILENVPKHLRMWINMAITWYYTKTTKERTLRSPNMPVMALAAWLFPSWDKYAIANAFLCVPAIVFCGLLIHESPRWLVSRGKVREAREVIRSQLKVSGQLDLMDDEFEDVLLREYSKVMEVNAKQRQYSYHHLFSSWSIAIHTTIVALSYLSTSIINYGIMFNMEQLTGSIYWNSVCTGLIRYVSNISFGFLDLKFKCIGRKFIHTSGLVVVIASLALVVFAYYFDLRITLKEEIRISILLAISMTSQIYIANGIVASELLPTPVRNIGYSYIQMWNRFGVVISPLVFYLQDYWIALPYCVMIILSTIDMFVFECCLPETKGKPLIEHMPGKEERIFGSKKSRRAPELVDSLISEKMLEEAASFK